MSESLNYLTSPAFVGSAAAVIITALALFLIKKYLIKKVAYTSKDEQHKNTFVGVIFNLLQYAVIIVAVVIVLELNGVNVTSIIAGLGIMATIVGLSLQDTLKDIISGINIYNNNFYKVGDIVKYNGEDCEVKYFSARVTKFKSLISGNTYTVCNSTVNAIEKVKYVIPILLTFDFEDDVKKIEKCYKDAVKVIENDERFMGFVYLGIVNITEKGAQYCAVINAPARDAFLVKVAYLNEMHRLMRKVGIEPSRDDERIVKKAK